MFISRRHFMQAAGLSGIHLVARRQGPPLWAALQASPCPLHAGPEFAPFINAYLEQLQPGRDNFITEQYAAELEAILAGWQDALCTAPSGLHAVSRVLSPALKAAALGKSAGTPVRRLPPIETEKVAFPSSPECDRAAFIEELRAYLAGIHKLETAEFQISSIQMSGTAPLQVATEICYDLVATLDHDRREERTGVWHLTWQKDSAGEWLILQWSAATELRCRLTGPGFVDITASSLGATNSCEQQLNHGVDYWRTVLDGACGIDIYGNNGIAAGDFDGDGFDDFYVCQPAGLPNRLYRNRGDGTFEDVTEKAGVGILDATSSALFADLDNNGRQDLIVVRTSGPLLYVNQGDGSFALEPDAFQFSKKPSGTFTGIAVADYDRDGLLDVYFCLYSFYQGLSEYQYPSPYYDAQNGPPNFLFKNRGHHSFEDVTASSGLDHSNNRFSFACSWRDYDRDGWPDLYVVNDFGRKVLYRNNRDGTFTDVSREAGVEDPGEGMSMTWLDYDNDGFDDLYVVNMWEPAGKRIMAQEQFLPDAPEDVRRVYQQDALGNTLLRNESGGAFRDVTGTAGTRLGGWNWGSDAWDLDHDGYPDLYITNGFISGPQKDNLSSFFWRQVVAQSYAGKGRRQAYEDAWNAINEFIRADHSWSGYQRNNCYVNNRDGSFVEAAGVLGLDMLDDSRAFALSDLNHDGRLNVIVKNRTGPQIRIFENRIAPLGLTIGFSLRGTRSNRDAVGAVIELETPAGRQQKSVSAGSGFLMQHTKDVYFGLGEVRQVVRATVRWPSGGSEVFENLPPSHRIEIIEGTGTCKAVPFAQAKALPRSLPQPAQAVPPYAPETWLVEAIRPPDFALADNQGKVISLREYQGRPLVLVFYQEDCVESQRQLQSLQEHWPQFQRSRLELLAILAGAPQSKSGAANQGFSFPMLTASQETSAVYNIFYRYLFERRRAMALPTAFLLNPAGEVIKVYSGLTDCTHILGDWQSALAAKEATLLRALPFPGPYMGKGFHHDYFAYGVAFQRYGFLDQALLSFREAIDRNPSYAAAYYNTGLIYLSQQKLAEARTNLEQAVALDPGNANVWNNLGVASGEAGDYTRALSAFQRALALEPAHLLALENLARIYKVQGRTDDARKLLESAIAADANQPALHLGLAMILVEKNELPGARDEFQKAIALDPRNAEALNGLGVVLMRLGDRTQAIARFEECRRLAPQSDRAYLNLALIYAKAGDLEKARAILNQYPQTQHDSPDVRRALRDLEGAR